MRENGILHLYTNALKELHALRPKHLIDTCVEIAAPKGTCLFTFGGKPTHMFFVVSGEVVLERPGLQGAPVILQRTRRGFISEASLKSPSYHCHGQVVTNSKIVQVPIRASREALDTDPAFSGRGITMLNKEVRRLRLQCERVSSRWLGNWASRTRRFTYAFMRWRRMEFSRAVTDFCAARHGSKLNSV